MAPRILWVSPVETSQDVTEITAALEAKAAPFQLKCCKKQPFLSLTYSIFCVTLLK